VAALAAGAAIAIAAVAPVGRSYLNARRVVGERRAEEARAGSATLRNYLGPAEANFLYGQRLVRFADSERRLFPGFVAIGLALLALGAAAGDRTFAPGGRRAIAAYALGLVLAVDVSLGFNGWSYPLFYEYALPFRGLRVPARMGIMAGFALAVLAGFGAAWLLRRRGGPAIVAALAALMLVEYASRPLDLRRIPTAPPATYADLVRDVGDSPAATLFEFPASALDDPTYMYFSTFHWQHLVNGYSGFFPPSYRRLADAVRDFPDAASIGAVKSRGPRYLLVHGERLFGARYEEIVARLAARPDLTLLSRHPAVGPGGHGEISLYRVSYAEP
jgi:hypothetical protein